MIKLFEMFAGFGGASFALEKAGIDFECVGYSEISKDAIKIYDLNHPGIKNFGDCKTLNPKEIPDFDLLTGGFPCQPFSVNTNQNARGEQHKEANLFMSIIKVLKEKQPKYILLENVKGIMGEKSKKIYHRIIDELINVGYDLKITSTNSKNHGTPQNRERVLFLGKLRKSGNFKELEFKMPEEVELKLTVADILEVEVERREPKIKKLKLAKEINKQMYGDMSRFDAIIRNPVRKKNSNVAFEILDAPSNVVSRQSDRIYNTNFAPCLTATGSDYIFNFKGKIIVLTPKECFRLMGFFNDEIKLGDISDTSLHKLAGNGWDINLMSKFLNNLVGGGNNGGKTSI